MPDGMIPPTSPDMSFEPPSRSIGGIDLPRSKTTWIIVAVVGVVIGYIIYKRFKSVGSEDVSGADSGVGSTYGYGAAVGGGGSSAGGTTDPPGPSTSPTGTKYEDNNQWAQAAIYALVQHGTNAIAANVAIYKYINGTTISEAESALVNAAIGYIGPPPVIPNVGITPPGGSNPTPTTHPTIKYGSKGPTVELLQRRLVELGYTTLSLQASKGFGSFGPKTLAAVKDFQAKNGLVVDGIVGPLTWAKLGV